MKYARTHMHNGVTHKAGDPFAGDVQTGRFLYQRGALAPDGSPDDDAITRKPGPRALQRWGLGEDLAAKPGVEPVHTGGGMYDVGPNRVRGGKAAHELAEELNAGNDTSTAWASPGEKE